MKERLIDKVKRKIRENRIAFWKRIVRKAVRRIDVLNDFAFMAYVWAADDVTDYHLTAERSYPDVHVFGTHVDHYDKEEYPLRCNKCSFYKDGDCEYHFCKVNVDDYCSFGAWTGKE